MREVHAELHVDCRNQLGEMPVWCGSSAMLYWVDVVRPGRVFHWSAAGGATGCFGFDHLVTGLDLTTAGELLVHGATDLTIYSPASGRSRPLWQLPATTHRLRLNDGHCDAAGRLWVGSMADNIGEDGAPLAITANVGQICMVSAVGSRHFDAELGCPNAICWSPDGGTFYIADSCDGWLYAYRFDLESATISGRRPFCRLDGLGIPDGAAVDADGCLWNARWGAGAVVRIRPDGSLAGIVRVPVSQPTACCFGDGDRRTLYITSAWFALGPEQRRAEPLAGSVFAVRTDVAGLELPRFRTSGVPGS